MQRSLTRNGETVTNVRFVVGREPEILLRNRIFQDENRPESGDHKRNGLRDGRRYSRNRKERRQKDFDPSKHTFGGHRLRSTRTWGQHDTASKTRRRVNREDGKLRKLKLALVPRYNSIG